MSRVIKADSYFGVETEIIILVCYKQFICMLTLYLL